MVIDPATEPKVVIRYLNQSGALVEVTQRLGTLYGSDYVRDVYTARCTACLHQHDDDTALLSPRTWAATHAEACRALPQPEPNQQ